MGFVHAALALLVGLVLGVLCTWLPVWILRRPSLKKASGTAARLLLLGLMGWLVASYALGFWVTAGFIRVLSL